MHADRRRFLNRTLRAALGASVYSAFGNLQLVRAAATQSSYAFTDYKALVCVFLYGGNDGFNTVIPVSSAQYAAYQAVRPSLATAQGQLLGLNAPANGAGSPGDGNAYGLHPSMPELAALFNQASSPMSVIANVGTLVGPVSKTQYANHGAALPPQLFSHADQIAYWQSAPPSNTPVTGWGGKLCDLLAASSGSTLPMLTSLGTEDAFIRGDVQNSYIMGTDGANTLDQFYDPAGAGINAVFRALHASGTQANALERAYAGTMNHSLATASIINSALGAQGAPDFASFFAGSGDLGAQLRTVARLIWAANNGIAGYGAQNRQVFFVTTGGFDTHDGQLGAQPALLGDLSKSLNGFHQALRSVNLANKATAFTASDFGRTLSTNGNGTDHGWGSHHFVVGGAVKGGKFYGDDLSGSGKAAMPSLALSENNPNDAGYGQIIPTTSVDQYSATLASWFGVGASDLSLLFPNLSHFSAKNLGFL